MRFNGPIDRRQSHPFEYAIKSPYMWSWFPIEINGKYFIIGDKWTEVSKKEHDEFLTKYKLHLTPRGAIADPAKKSLRWEVPSGRTIQIYIVQVDDYDILICSCTGYHSWGNCYHARNKRSELHLPYLMRKEKENGLTLKDIVY